MKQDEIKACALKSDQCCDWSSVSGSYRVELDGAGYHQDDIRMASG